MTSAILPPGTICFLVRITSHAGFSGRVVTVAEAPVTVDGEPPEDEPWHLCAAPWVAEAFPGRTMVLTPRRCLLPIGAPAAPVGEREAERTEEPAR